MYPVICKIGPFVIYSYGLMFALGSLVSLVFLVKAGKKSGISSNFFYDLYVWILIGAIIGARLLYVLTNMSFFIPNPREIIMIAHGGLSWFGGFIFGLIAFSVVVLRYRFSFLRLADLCVPFVALAQGIGRIGCFLNGCCYGKPTSFIFKVNFPGFQEAVHPTQLYSAASLFLIFIILSIYKKLKDIFVGEILCLYLLLCGLERFFCEFLRADTIKTLVLGLTLYQIFSIFWIITALMLYEFIKRPRK